MTRILCLWLPNWPIQRLVHARPELNRQPIVLVAEGPRGGWVAACSHIAAAQGIRPAMPVAEAKSLVPAVVLMPHEPPRDRQALEQLAEACEQFSPCVGLEEGGEPTCLLLDISNLEHLWGSEAVLVEQVKKFFTCGGYRVRLGVAGTVGAAWALTHCGEEDGKLMMWGWPTKPPAEPRAAGHAQFPVPSLQPPAPEERRGRRSEERDDEEGERKGEGGEINPNDETRLTNKRMSHSSFVICHLGTPTRSTPTPPHPGPLPEGEGEELGALSEGEGEELGALSEGEGGGSGALPKGEGLRFLPEGQGEELERIPEPSPAGRGQGEGKHDVGAGARILAGRQYWDKLLESLNLCREFPVEALRITGDTATLLRQLGIETIEQLLSLPREELAPRFGEELLQRLDQLIGAVPEVIEPHRPSAPLAASQALEEPTTDRSQLTHVLRELVERLSRRLAARDQGAVLLMCSLRCTDGRAQPLRVGLLEPSANARQLMELIGLHLEAVRLTAEVDRVEIRVAVTGRLGQRQGELFADRWPSDSHQIALLINRLSSRLGCEQVLRAELRASPVPERTVRWVAAVERGARSEGRGARRRGKAEGGRRKEELQSANSSGHSRLHSPLWPTADSRQPIATRPLLLHSRPQALEVVCVAPDGPPQFVWLDGRRERVMQHVGPERIETLWWQGPAVRRDYYRVAVESGSHLWLFRHLADGRWFLHGVFE